MCINKVPKKPLEDRHIEKALSRATEKARKEKKDLEAIEETKKILDNRELAEELGIVWIE